MEQAEWEALSPEEKRKDLYRRQKQTLDFFLERNAITKLEYEKSLHRLTEKMGMQEYTEN